MMNDFGAESYWASSEIGNDYWIAVGGSVGQMYGYNQQVAMKLMTSRVTMHQQSHGLSRVECQMLQELLVRYVQAL